MSEENERLREELEYWSKLISAHKKSLALQETSSKVSASSAQPSLVSDGFGNAVKKKCSSSVSYSEHRAPTADQTSALPVTNSTAEYASGDHIKSGMETVDHGVGANLADVSISKESRDNDTAASSVSCQLSTLGVQAEEISNTVDTQCETSRQKSSDVAAALASDMVNLYRNKVLPKNNPVLHSQPSTTSVATADSTIKHSGHSVRSVQLPDASAVQFKETVAMKVPHPLVSKSAFKLVNAKTLQSSAHCKNFVPPVPKSSHFDSNPRSVLRQRTPFPTPTSSFGQTDSRPSSALTSTTRTVASSFAVPRSLLLQITISSSTSNAPSKPSSCATSFTNSIPGKDATTESMFTSSKYKLIRNKESTYRSTSRRAFVTSPKDTSGSLFVAHRVNKHSPSLLVVNKYKVVRKKQQSSAKKTPSVKRMATPVKSSRDVTSHSQLCRNSSTSNSKTRSSRYKLVRRNNQPHSTPIRPITQPSHGVPQLCRNSSTSNSKTRSSRYKLVRRNSQPHSTPVKPFTQAASTRADDRVQVFSKYKVVHRRSSGVMRTPQHATSTPIDRSQHFIPNIRSLSNKHLTPPLFLNKYKLIRKKALFKPTSNYSTSRSSLPRKRRTRKQSFMSKYALQRSGQAIEAKLDVNHMLGRKVKNLSKNKYKFVSGSAGSRRRSSRRTPLPRKSQLKIDRRSSSARRASQNRRRFLARTGSSVYKLRRKLCPGGTATAIVNRRLSFRAPLRVGKSSRLSSGRTASSSHFSQRKFNWMRWSAADQRKKLAAESKNYCTFFNRFGRCSRGDQCKYIHDPDKVSVCTRFLRGTCKVTDCPFSHRVAPHKMPTCRYFLQGICNRDDCPYRHVNVAVDAEICFDFARGYCSLADLCKKKHVTVCPEFTDTGACPRGRRCPLRHAAKKRPLCSVTAAVKTEDNAVGLVAKKQKIINDDDDDDIMLPLRQRRLPSFIAIDDTTPTPSTDAEAKSNVGEALMIRPRLAPISTSHDLSWLLDP